MLISGSFWQNKAFEFSPRRFELSILIDSDFELPGLPIIRIGILFIKQTNEVKTFSIKAELYAIF
jgi:hypothetical protein